MSFSIDATQIAQAETRFRANLIQTALGFKAVMLMGTQNKDGVNNLAIFNNLIHISANPPVIGVQFRPANMERHSLENLLITGCFSLNQVPESHWKQAHQTSAKYDADTSEFDACGFTSKFHGNIPAPMVAESPLSMVLKFQEQIPIGKTGVTLVLGEIVYLQSNTPPLPDGFIEPTNNNIITSAGADGYYTAQKKGRLSYARPFEDLSEI
jgi:flavin reductase (DIM6/NTAB) family NADH-FMN oxidoreductase RutF